MRSRWTYFPSSDPFVRFLEDLAKSRVYLQPYSGNAGDHFIRLGLCHALRFYRVKKTLEPDDADVVIYPGGSASLWQCGVDVWQSQLTKHPRMLLAIGPSTWRGSSTPWSRVLLEHADRICAVFARDRRSHAVLSNALEGRVAMGLSHDPALFLADSQLIQKYRRALRAEYALISFRDDHESAIRLPFYVRIVRKCAQSPYGTWVEIAYRRAMALRTAKKVAARLNIDRNRLIIEDVSLVSPPLFLDRIRCASEVHTNRLHVMIVAVLLGKRVFAYETSYGKLEAVYEHSLAGNSEADVHFCREKL